MEKAYDALAAWFEYLNDDCDYPAWSQYFIETLRRLNAGRKGLELGCGSGAFCRALAREGYQMSGADLSPCMLATAERLSREEGLNIPYFQTDAARLSAPDTYDFILSPNDCFNYISPNRLKAAFERIRKSLVSGGYFLFDVSSEYKLLKKVADTVSVDDREQVTYFSFNSLKGDRVEMDVTLFVKRSDGAFERYDERHIQYIQTEDHVTAALRAAGFTLLTVEGHLGENKDGSDRLNFICRK